MINVLEEKISLTFFIMTVDDVFNFFSNNTMIVVKNGARNCPMKAIYVNILYTHKYNDYILLKYHLAATRFLFLTYMIFIEENYPSECL